MPAAVKQVMALLARPDDGSPGNCADLQASPGRHRAASGELISYGPLAEEVRARRWASIRPSGSRLTLAAKPAEA